MKSEDMGLSWNLGNSREWWDDHTPVDNFLTMAHRGIWDMNGM